MSGDGGARRTRRVLLLGVSDAAIGEVLPPSPVQRDTIRATLMSQLNGTGIERRDIHRRDAGGDRGRGVRRMSRYRALQLVRELEHRRDFEARYVADRVAEGEDPGWRLDDYRRTCAELLAAKLAYELEVHGTPAGPS